MFKLHTGMSLFNLKYAFYYKNTFLFDFCNILCDLCNKNILIKKFLQKLHILLLCHILFHLSPKYHALIRPNLNTLSLACTNTQCNCLYLRSGGRCINSSGEPMPRRDTVSEWHSHQTQVARQRRV